MIDKRFFESYGPFSLSEILDGLAVETLGAKFDDVVIASAATLSASKPSDICFLDSAKHKEQVETAKATACFVPEKLAGLVSEQGILPIISKAPRAHFARTLAKLYKVRTFSNSSDPAKIAKTARIHKSVIIGSGAIIEDGVEIAPNAVIGPGVHVGANTYIGPNAVIDCAVIGSNCTVKASAVIGGAGFGVARDESGAIDIPHIGRIIIGNRVSIGSQTCVDRGQLDDTVLGDDVKIDNLVQVGHNVKIGDGTVIAGHVGIAGSCTIGKNVQLGGNAGLVDHISVGDGASVAARAGVMHNIPAGEVWSGVPAMPIRDHMRLISATRKLVPPKKKRET